MIDRVELLLKYLDLWCENETSLWEDRANMLNTGQLSVSDVDHYREVIREVTREVERFKDIIKVLNNTNSVVKNG